MYRFRASIVIPVYNGEAFLADAIVSALKQRFEDFEIVVCDNASTDNSLEVANSFRADGKVKIVCNQSHVNAPQNFNRALQQASGEYIRFLCHDDILDPGCLELSVSALEMFPTANVATSFATAFGARSRTYGQEFMGAIGLVNSRDALNSIIDRGNWVGGPSAVTLRRAALPTKPFDEGLTCSYDVAAWINLVKNADIVVIPSVLYHSRVHEAQATTDCLNGGFKRDWIQILRMVGREDLGVPRRKILRSRLMNSLGPFRDTILRFRAGKRC